MRTEPVEMFVQQLAWPRGVVDIYHFTQGDLTSIWTIIERLDAELETRIAECQSEVLRKFQHTKLSFRVLPKGLSSVWSSLPPDAVKCKKALL